jgi:hypothetical protein
LCFLKDKFPTPGIYAGRWQFLWDLIRDNGTIIRSCNKTILYHNALWPEPQAQEADIFSSFSGDTYDRLSDQGV